MLLALQIIRMLLCAHPLERGLEVVSLNTWST